MKMTRLPTAATLVLLGIAASPVGRAALVPPPYAWAATVEDCRRPIDTATDGKPLSVMGMVGVEVELFGPRLHEAGDGLVFADLSRAWHRDARARVLRRNSPKANAGRGCLATGAAAGEPAPGSIVVRIDASVLEDRKHDVLNLLVPLGGGSPASIPLRMLAFPQFRGDWQLPAPACLAGTTGGALRMPSPAAEAGGGSLWLFMPDGHLRDGSGCVAQLRLRAVLPIPNRNFGWGLPDVPVAEADCRLPERFHGQPEFLRHRPISCAPALNSGLPLDLTFDVDVPRLRALRTMVDTNIEVRASGIPRETANLGTHLVTRPALACIRGRPNAFQLGRLNDAGARHLGAAKVGGDFVLEVELCEPAETDLRWAVGTASPLCIQSLSPAVPYNPAVVDQVISAIGQRQVRIPLRFLAAGGCFPAARQRIDLAVTAIKGVQIGDPHDFNTLALTGNAVFTLDIVRP